LVTKATANRSDFNYGVESGPYQTEKMAKIDREDGELKQQKPHKIDMDGVWGSKAIHYGDHVPDYNSVYKVEHDCKGNPLEIRAKLDEEAKAILRRTNYKLGVNCFQGNTTHNSTFSNRKGGGAPKLTEAMKKDLKGDHSCYGTDKENWATTYGSFHNWKEVPDEDKYE